MLISFSKLFSVAVALWREIRITAWLRRHFLVRFKMSSDVMDDPEPDIIPCTLDSVKESIGYPFNCPVIPTTCPFPASSFDLWQWDPKACGPKVVIIDDSTAVFHPEWSNNTQAVRGTRILNQTHGQLWYWEVVFATRVFGTAMMVGVGTADARLESPSFEPIIGEDCESWGLSHKGFLQHNKERKPYCKAFLENTPTVIGVLYNGRDGTVTFYKDGVCLGVAFSGLDKREKSIYPMISSTAAKTVMHLRSMRRGHETLQDKCRDVIVRRLCEPGDVYALPLPYHLRNFIFKHAWKTRAGDGICYGRK